ncbi:hypothetical protein [Variovorax sp. HJSM1_2]|uniref:hypothetical protein n=1 Tax=Variovorax sp. HJSM1_2 TaxID=3366263 RepID=UPI003BBD0E47
MPSKLENLNETKDGARFSMEGDWLGTHITVVTAYDGNYDDWPYHVYLQTGESPRQRLTTRPTTRRGSTKLSAFEQGLLLAVNSLTRAPKSAGTTTTKKEAPAPNARPPFVDMGTQMPSHVGAQALMPLD